eukprot:SAG31_NODE_4069_length_3619_cov_17.893466_1_plen_164_part_00
MIFLTDSHLPCRKLQPPSAAQRRRPAAAPPPPRHPAHALQCCPTAHWRSNSMYATVVSAHLHTQLSRRTTISARYARGRGGSVSGKVAKAARLLKLDCPEFVPGRSYKSRGELSSFKQDRSQKAPTSRTTSSVGAEKHPPSLTLSCFCSHVVGFLSVGRSFGT